MLLSGQLKIVEEWDSGCGMSHLSKWKGDPIWKTVKQGEVVVEKQRIYHVSGSQEVDIGSEDEDNWVLTPSVLVRE